MTMSRRELFTWFRRPVDEPAVVEPAVAQPVRTPDGNEPSSPDGRAPGTTDGAFSLDAFYAQREADRTIPAFAIRATAAAETSRVGVGPVDAASATPATAEVTTIAPDLVPAVLEHRCLATRSFCSVCVERCPVAGAIVVELGRPRVDPARCDGCGRCVLACPAPVLAFELAPRAKKAPR